MPPGKAPSRPRTHPWVGLKPGDVVAERYRVEVQLGAGGMGVVYRAHDLELDEKVALKVLLLGSGNVERKVSRFKKEIKLARKIVHPNVCRIYDIGSHEVSGRGEIKFVTMELIQGQPLDRLLESPGALDFDRKLELFQGLLKGLRAAHRIQIIHRDIKPQNVIVTPEGRPVIMDFGLARDLEASEVTAGSDVVGTPLFMAPEQLLGEKVDHRGDIYALGVILFEFATGQKPHGGSTIFEIAQKQLNQEPPRPTSINPELPAWVEKVVLKMLAKRPEDRFQSVDEVLALLETGTDKTTKKVLIVDDDPVFRTLAEAHLLRFGIRVITAENGAEGLELLLAEEPDLVCVDFRMPDLDGFFVADYIQQLEPAKRPPVFMMTAIQDPQYEKQATRLGIERFFTKPVNGDELAAAVAERLAAAG